ncbi:PucR family transcriptional regulator [Nocardioides hwasunensis]|uniref:Helix-turn-helix domain-containing protein n=1 Tax=Nocardioides hwasunensis TaxID=397258 RepID=A0ABR8MHW5_9ACTN|nr:PucR family transcriptional regulator [Nocardioides hwasunensis]MBD3915656.1 helix-turn-helix domain-containing protein [Nocardioides hwasunensis]
MDLDQPRPRLSLRRVLDDLGVTFLDLVLGQADESGEVGGVAIWDAADPPSLPPRALVLGVGVSDPHEVRELLAHVADHDVAGVVLRAPVQHDADVTELAGRTGACVLGLSRGASWAQLTEMIRSMLTPGDLPAGQQSPDSLGGLPSGDLFAVANAVAALMGAPITIEDRSSRVLAFSGRQDEADPSRVETILGRQVPERYARILQERGVFRALNRSDDPVFIEPLPSEEGRFTMPRVAIAVRAGDEVLGSVWAAVSERPDAARLEVLQDSAKLVALHMLRHRAGSDAARRIRADLLSTSLAGGTNAHDALVRLGLAGRPLTVLGLRLVLPPGEEQSDVGPDDASVAQERQRLTDAFAMHLAAVQPVSAVAAIGDTTYGLLAAAEPLDEAEGRAARLLADFVARVDDRVHPLAAVGPLAADLQGITRSRIGVDRVLRVLAEGGGGHRVGRLEELQGQAMVLDLRDQAVQRGEQVRGGLARLLAYDDQHGSQLVGTLRAWLDALGDVGVAAEQMFVHPNTFRYRLRRVAEVGEVDLDDAEQRFSLMLQLRVFGLGR